MLDKNKLTVRTKRKCQQRPALVYRPSDGIF